MRTARSVMLGIAATAAMTGGVLAADFDPYVPEEPAPTFTPPASTFTFEGFYAGILGGALWDLDADDGVDYLTDGDDMGLHLGAAAGVNFYLTDTVLGGFEVQGGANFSDSGTSYDALALARVGFAPTPEAMVYAAGGVGIVNHENVYALGAGAEVAATDQLGIRGEVLGLGSWHDDEGGDTDFINGTKATVGLMWHMP